MAGLFGKIMRRAQQERRLLGVRTSQGENQFSVGYVLSFSEEVVLLRVINRDGIQTGIRSYNLDNIFQVDFDDRYIRHIEFKANNLDKVYAGLQSPAFMAQEYVTVPLLLTRAMEAQQLVFVTSQVGPGLYGYVRRLADEQVLLECYTEFGEPDGLNVIRIDNIVHVAWSDEETRMIELHLKLREQRGPQALDL